MTCDRGVLGVWGFRGLGFRVERFSPKPKTAAVERAICGRRSPKAVCRTEGFETKAGRAYQGSGLRVRV